MSSKKITELDTIGNRLKIVRGDLPIKEFARQLGITPAYIYDLEGDKKTKISYTLAELISSKFNISRQWVMTGLGWTYYPQDSIKTINWIKEMIEKNKVKRVAIIKYFDDDKKKISGFVIETEYGVFSVNRIPYHVNVDHYIKMLIALRDAGASVGIITTDKTTAGFDSIDFSTYLNEATYREGIIDEEIIITYTPPEQIEEFIRRDKELAMQRLEISYDSNFVNLVKKIDWIIENGNFEENVTLFGTIEVLYNEVKRRTATQKKIQSQSVSVTEKPEQPKIDSGKES